MKTFQVCGLAFVGAGVATTFAGGAMQQAGYRLQTIGSWVHFSGMGLLLLGFSIFLLGRVVDRNRQRIARFLEASVVGRAISPARATAWNALVACSLVAATTMALSLACVHIFSPQSIVMMTFGALIEISIAFFVLSGVIYIIVSAIEKIGQATTDRRTETA